MFTGLLSQEMSVRTRSITADAYAGQSVSRSTIYTLRPCRAVGLTNEQRVFLSRSGIEATHRFFCEADLTIEIGYELIVGTTVYEVVGVDDFCAGGSDVHHLELLTRDQT